MENTIDLHIHSNYSDGTESPGAIVQEALDKDLKYISLTDHESMEGYHELYKIKNLWKDKLTIIPGVELHAYYKGYEIHVLGYFLDESSAQLHKKLKELRQQRTAIAQDTVEMLNRHGYVLPWSMVEERFPGDIAITKAHVIDALKTAQIPITRQMFIDFFSTRGKNYIPFTDHHLEEALQLIKNSGGLAFLAHPGLIGNEEIVEELVTNYDLGLEVYYHYFGEKAQWMVDRYEKLGQDREQLISGGSDYHGTITPVAIGDTYVPPKVIEDLLMHKNS